MLLKLPIIIEISNETTFKRLGISVLCDKTLFPIFQSTLARVATQRNLYVSSAASALNGHFFLFSQRYTHQTTFLEKVAACIICGQAVVHVGIICEHVNEKTSSVRSQIQQTLRWGRQEGWRFKRRRETRVDFRWLMWRYIVHYVRINHGYAGTAFYRT